MSLHAIRAMCVSVIYVPMCKSAKVPNACQLLIFTFQRANKRANVPKLYQLFNLVCQHAKSEPIFHACQKAYQFFNYFSKEFFNFWNFQLCSTFANFRNISAILENLSHKTIKFKFWHLQNFIKEKPCQPSTFASFSMEHVGLTEQFFG